jgi:Right handed beta helix region
VNRRAVRERPSARRSIVGVVTTLIVIVGLTMPSGIVAPLLAPLLAPITEPILRGFGPHASDPPPSSAPSPFIVGSPAQPVVEPPVIPERTPASAGLVDAPASIDATGGQDVTSAIQAFIDATPDGSTIRFVPAGRYRIEGTIHVLRRTNLTIDGRGATFVATQQTADPDRAHWWIDASTDIQLRDLTVEGAHPAPGTYVAGFEWQHAIQIYGGSDIEIGPGITTTNNQGDGVYVARWADGVHIHDCRISWNGRMGVAVVAGRNVVVERCRLDHIAYSAFDIEPNEGTDPPEGAERITFRDNEVDGPVFSKFLGMSGYGPISQVLVTRNHVTGAQNGIAVDARPIEGTPRRSDITITDNVGDGVFGGFDAVMDFETVDRLTVVGNRQAVAPGGIVFALGGDWTDVRIEDNDCPGCAS